MTRFLFIVTIFILFIIEGTIMQLVAPERWGMDVLMIPRFVVVLLILSALFLGRLQGMILGIVFGLMYDIVYGSVIGIYAFSMGFVGYFSGLTFRIFQQNIVLILIIVAAFLVVHEFMIYSIFYLIGFVDLSVNTFFIERIIPTLVLNMIFALLVSYPVRLIMLQMQQEEES